jgi:hypothetical protein
MRRFLHACTTAFAALLFISVASLPGAARQSTSSTGQTRDAASGAAVGTAVISGTLVALDSGRPVRRARVSISSTGPDAGSVGQSVTTDDAGGFSFTGLPAGTFTLAATKPGYLDSIYGQKRPGTARPGTPIQIADGQKIEHLAFALARGGAISGTVTDEQGEPMFRLEVRAYRYTMRSGERSLQPAGSTSTDDRGGYRLGVLSPGEYIVTAVPREASSDDQNMVELKMTAEALAAKARGADEQTLQKIQEAIMRTNGAPTDDQPEGYAPIYFPGSTQMSGATPVLVEVGQERSGVDLQLQLVRAARISGTVTSADGSAPQGALSTTVTLIDNDQVAPGQPGRSGRAGTDGKFSISGVPPGRYTLLARSIRPVSASADKAAQYFSGNVTQLYATSDLVVDGRNVPDISLVLQKGMTVSGSVKLDAAGGAFDLTHLRIALTPVGSSGGADLYSAMPAVVDAAGRFSLAGVLPARYKVTVAGQPGSWTPKSAVFGGRDALDLMLEVKSGEDQAGVITLTTRQSVLSGLLQDSAGQPTSTYTIVVFSADPRFWTPQSRRIMATRPATDGRYAFTGLPAGDYRLVAVTDAEPGQWFDPAFLRELANVALPISIGDGERKSQDLRVK